LAAQGWKVAAAYITGAWLPVDGGIGLSNLTLGSEHRLVGHFWGHMDPKSH
jgi:hypothetical protein